ncbi:hypothetical protein [Roseixanthobacter pseudopolyaromaticivorans]|uniref:hypothetical protein n=1 Tax=Xanthobacteraceae TaxID=335928 RepID=UPI0037299909
MEVRTYEGPANFRITVLKERRAEQKRSVELHVPGFFTWVLAPDRARDLASELAFAAEDVRKT